MTTVIDYTPTLRLPISTAVGFAIHVSNIGVLIAEPEEISGERLRGLLGT